MEQGHPMKQSHPIETSNVFTRISFLYDLKLFFKGYKSSLESKDLYEVLQSCRSKQLGDELEKQWQKELKENKKPSICHALWVCHGKTFLILGLMQLVVKTLTTAWLPQASSKVIAYFSPGQNMTSEDAIYYVSVTIGISIFNVFFYYNCLLALTELGIRVRTSLCSLLYRKSLKLSVESLSQVTVGKIITIMTKDVDVFFNFVYYGNDVWIPLVQTGVICYLIYCKIGVASFAGIAFFLVVLPLQVLIGKWSYPLRLKSSKKTDERLGLIQEVLSSIKIIKMYTWETYFTKKINSARKEELKKLHRLFFTKVWIVIIGSICSKLAFFIFFLTYVYMGNSETTITAEIVFYILSCSNDLEYSLSTLIPLGLSYAAEAYATTKRIDNVLAVKELSPNQELRDENPKIIFSDVTIEINQRKILELVCLNLEKGVNVVVGHIGSGKTTLLKSILQEFDMKGDVKISGSISYASQEPWLFPSTIRHNIIFGEKYCEQRYKEVLRVCNLDYDLNLFPDGDNTIVGDRGLNLSKGQQTRINFARAVYRDSDIYLLDDCLASLDVYVSNCVFEECILKFLKNKLCVLVTTNRDYATKADNVILINGGMIKVNKNLENAELEDERNDQLVIQDKDEQKNFDNEQVYSEVKKPGKVSLKDYYKYVANGGGLILFGVVMGLFVVAQIASNYSDKMLSTWVTLEDNFTNYTLRKNVSGYETMKNETNYILNLYTAIVISSVLLNLAKYLAFFYFTKTASINLHKAMIQSVLNAKMSFFDSNFLGNILNRFSKDCLTVDENLPFIVIECLGMIFVATGGIILLGTINLIFFVESLFLVALAYLLKRFCQPTGRNLQRLNVATRSPMIGHLNSTLEGLTTIRASNVQEKVIEEFDNHQNLYTSANYMLSNCQIALGFGLEFLSTIFISLIMIQFLVTTTDPSVGDVGLAISQSFIITNIISEGTKNISECENLMTSVERIVEYTELEKEIDEGVDMKEWPKLGKIEYDQVSLNYNNSSKDVLENIYFTIKPKEKLGIVGRTGAGKSSIISTLLRLYQIKGKIKIDDTNTQNISLHWLRSNISVIPQDPILFSGTIRQNLDPLNRFEDEQIWKILEQLKLKDMISDLSIKINKSSTFSAGQKQLFCLCRAILRKNKIVILDEATANVDHDTDCLIGEAVERHFKDSTVIIIAHKLESILTCDKVLVLDKGRVSEFGEPQELLKDKKSFLYSVKS